jgi:RNA polymerase sigma-70 factor (ECF subfamily)
MLGSQQGEVDARKQFCSRLVDILPDLRAFARVLCRENDRADDLVQDAMVRAIAAIDQFQPGSNFKAWVFTILRNLHISSFRERRFLFEPLEEVDRVLLQAPGQEDAMAMRTLDDAVQRLAPVRRQALILVVAHGLSYEEVAAMCGCAVGTIKSRVARAREELHAAVDGGALRPELSLRNARKSVKAAVRKAGLNSLAGVSDRRAEVVSTFASCAPVKA